jgi:hypothetical protein
MPPMQAAASYAFGPARIAVATDDVDAARWLEEFLAPWFRVETGAPCDWRVVFRRSHEEHAALEALARGAPSRPLACFALDNRTVELAAFEADGERVLAEPESRCFLRLRPNEIEIVARPEGRSARVALLRVVRELAATRRRSDADVLDLHAAGFERDGAAILIAGPKQAGKSTLLVHALASGRARLLANDRVQIDTSVRPVLATGIPTIVSLRSGTLERFPRLLAAGPPVERPLLLHAAELAACAPGPAPSAERLTLSPLQLARRLGAGCTPAAPVAALLFPEIDAQQRGSRLERLAADAAARAIATSRYGVRMQPRPRTVFEELVKCERPEPRDDALVTRLAGELPCFRCRLGPDAYEQGPDALLEALARAL